MCHLHMGLFHGGINRHPPVLGSVGGGRCSQPCRRCSRREYDVSGEDSWLSSCKRRSNGENARTVLVATANANSKVMAVAANGSGTESVAVNPDRFSYAPFVGLRSSALLVAGLLVAGFKFWLTPLFWSTALERNIPKCPY